MDVQKKWNIIHTELKRNTMLYEEGRIKYEHI